MLAQMVKMTLEEGDALVLPESARVQFVDNANYETYRETLGGLTTENEPTLRMKL